MVGTESDSLAFRDSRRKIGSPVVATRRIEERVPDAGGVHREWFVPRGVQPADLSWVQSHQIWYPSADRESGTFKNED